LEDVLKQVRIFFNKNIFDNVFSSVISPNIHCHQYSPPALLFGIYLLPSSGETTNPKEPCFKGQRRCTHTAQHRRKASIKGVKY